MGFVRRRDSPEFGRCQAVILLEQTVKSPHRIESGAGRDRLDFRRVVAQQRRFRTLEPQMVRILEEGHRTMLGNRSRKVKFIGAQFGGNLFTRQVRVPKALLLPHQPV